MVIAVFVTVMPARLDRKPTKADLAAAHNKTVPDVIAGGLQLLFVGINPGLYSAAVGHHFARPGNRFWPALFRAGLTDRLLDPSEERQLLGYGLGVTNLVARASARAEELTDDELKKGARRLAAKVKRYRIGCVAVLGLTAYRKAFDCTDAVVGRSKAARPDMGGMPVWVLPNPSGLNAHFQLDDFARLFRKLAADFS